MPIPGTIYFVMLRSQAKQRGAAPTGHARRQPGFDPLVVR